MANSKISAPLVLSDELAAFMGKSKASRGDVTKAVWKYIRDEKLNCDRHGEKFSGGKVEFDEVLSAVLHSKGMKKASDLFAILKKAKAFV